MASDVGKKPRTLSDGSKMLARSSEFGTRIQRLLGSAGSSAAATVAWPGSVFKRDIDGRQRSDLDVHALLKRGAKHLDARRIGVARLAAVEIARNLERLEELDQLAREWSPRGNEQVLVWTSLVGVKRGAVDTGFRVLVPSRSEDLRQAVISAWASAYELALLEDLAQYSVRRFSVAVALSLLPLPGTFGELFLAENEGAGGLSALARLASASDSAGWFSVETDREAASERTPQTPVQRVAAELGRALPRGTWHAEFYTADDALWVTGVRQSETLNAPARWVAWEGEFAGSSTHFGHSLLMHFEEHAARRVLDRLGARSRRQGPWLQTLRGRAYLNLALIEPLASALDASPALLDGLAGGALEPVAIRREQRFRAPRLLAELSLLDSRLRGQVRQFEARALAHARWFEELDLAILPDDALPTTLRETREFMTTAGALYLETELALIRALSGLAELGSDGERLDLRQVFATLIVDGELASIAHSIDFDAALARLAADPSAREALQRGVRAVEDLPEGRAKRELYYHQRHHGFWIAPSEFSCPTTEQSESAFLSSLLVVNAVGSGERAERIRAALDRRQAATRLLSGANGWLGRQALGALFERVASFARMHETLRVILARSYSILRQAVVDTGRRLARLNPALEADAVWHLSFDELRRAVQYSELDLTPVVEERRRCLRQLSRLPSPGRRLRELVSAPGPPRLGSRLSGVPTATGQFMGRVRRLDGLSSERPLSLEDVLVGRSFNGSLSILLGHAGAVASATGGTLSHAAFVARQLGVPAVVGLGEAIDVLEEGDEVVVDGNEGVLLRTRGGLARP